jgi:hypothetical protein
MRRRVAFLFVIAFFSFALSQSANAQPIQVAPLQSVQSADQDTSFLSPADEQFLWCGGGV